MGSNIGVAFSMEFADETKMLAEWRWRRLLSAGRVIEPSNRIAIYFYSSADVMAKGKMLY